MNPQDFLLRYMEYCFHDTVEHVYCSPDYLLPRDSPAVLLDCGCHDGQYTEKLSGLVHASHAYGLEYNWNLAKSAKQTSVRVIVCDLNDGIPFRSNSMDIITAFNVLEHLVETERYLSEVFRILLPGGCALINTPNLASWHNIAALVLGMQPFSGPNISSMVESDIDVVRRMHRRAHGLSEHEAALMLREPERYRHIVVVAFRSLLLTLKRIGFQIDQALGFGYYPLPPVAARIASRLDPAHAHHMVIKAVKPD